MTGAGRGARARMASAGVGAVAARPPQEALAAFFGFDQNLPRISFQRRLFGRSVASFFGFDQIEGAHLVKTENSCQPRAEKRGSRCETVTRFGQNRKKLPAPSSDAAMRRKMGMSADRRRHARGGDEWDSSEQDGARAAAEYGGEP